MRKRVFGRRFKRDINQRKSLFKGLMISLVVYGRIKTTEAKAKAIKGQIEKIVTHAKNNPSDGKHYLSRYFTEAISDKIINDIAPRFKTRPGGYTRIIKIGKRVKDNAPLVLIEWVEKGQAVEAPKEFGKKEAKSVKEEKTKPVKKVERKNAKPNKTNKK